MIVFGVGNLWGIPLTDGTGAAIANPTPARLATLQEASGDLSFDEKTLYGAYQMPLAFGRGKGKLTFKAKLADFDARVYGSLFFGVTPVAGIFAAVADFSSSIPTTPFQITVAPPSSGTFTTDLGVKFTATGISLTRVASAPATGQYSVSGAGLYTFAAADTGLGVLISYEYTATSTSLFKIPFANQLMGYAPSFIAEFNLPYNGRQLTMRLNNCVSSKLSLPFKNDDFAIQDFDFTALADSAGNIGTFAVA